MRVEGPHRRSLRLGEEKNVYYTGTLTATHRLRPHPVAILIGLFNSYSSVKAISSCYTGTLTATPRLRPHPIAILGL
jgi:hypothetical protein